MSRAFDLRRREFLISTCAAWPLARASGDADAPEFHLHPHYRIAAPFDDLESKVDEFTLEREHDRIAAVLAQWSRDLRAMERSLASGFVGVSLEPSELRVVRSGPSLEVRHCAFSPQAELGREAFTGQLRSFASAFTKIHHAEFQVTRLDTQSDGALRTRVRFELVGEGPGFYREQRIGWWDLEWLAPADVQPTVRKWDATEETRSRSGKPWFEDIAPFAFASAASWPAQMLHGVDHWRTVLDGACGIDIYGHNGVSVGDIDNDGFDDLYVCQPAGLPNRLYRNRGDGTFEDITESSGTGLLDNCACAIFADFTHHGRQDLVVVRATGPVLLVNEGDGKFGLRPDAFQFANPPQGTFTGAAAADYDRDGWLDIYFCLYSYYQGADQYQYPSPYYAAENGPPNFMMRNNRDGTFRDVTAACGLSQNNTRYSFCCGWADSNRDGWPDLYVVNDFGRKNLYRNNGDGTFTDIATSAGVEDTGAGMSVCWFDSDNDGLEDLYVGDMWTAAGERISRYANFQPAAPESVRALYRKHAMGNSLLRNLGNGSFEDRTVPSGAGLSRWAWSSDAWDFDHDGFADLYIANGMISGPIRDDLNSFFWRQVVAKSPNMGRPSQDYEQGWNAINDWIRSDHTWSGYERNVFYANNRDGTFSDVSGALGIDFIEDGRSFALADFDHDGRQELFLKNRTAPQLRVLKNVLDDLPPAIAFRLRGTNSNPDAIGAVITVQTGAARQTRTLQAGSGFLSQHSKDLFFGLGAEKPIRASIHWPSGLVQELGDSLPPNHLIYVEEGLAPRAEPFRQHPIRRPDPKPQPIDVPATIETWLLAPVPAPGFSLPSDLRSKPLLLTFASPTLLEVRPGNIALRLTDDVAAVYNLLYRYIFDRHRDLVLPASFLIDARGNIVKVYQGPLPPGVEKDFSRIPQTREQRLSSALPFPGNSATYSYGRNHLSLGAVFFQRGYYDQSVTYFERALRDDPSSAEAHYGIGSVYLNQGRNAEARPSFEKALKATASYPDTAANTRNNLGILAARDGRVEEAIGWFQETLRLSPDYWTALENLGNAYRQQKRWDEARATLEQAVAARPDHAEAAYSLAMVYAQLDDTARAREYLERALALRPAYPEALNNLGVLFLRTGHREDAIAKFEQCIRIAPTFAPSYLNLARVYAIEGDRDKARAVLLRLLKEHPGDPQAEQALAQLQ